MDSKMTEAFKEVGAILKKHNLAGCVLINSSTHVDYEMFFDAGWLCIKPEINEAGEKGIRIRCKREDYDSTAAQKEALETAIGSLVSMDHAISKVQEGLQSLLVAVSHHVDFLGKSTKE